MSILSTIFLPQEACVERPIDDYLMQAWMNSLLHHLVKIGLLTPKTEVRASLYQEGTRAYVFWLEGVSPDVVLIISHAPCWNDLTDLEYKNLKLISCFRPDLAAEPVFSGRHEYSGLLLAFYTARRIAWPSIYSEDGRMFAYMYGLVRDISWYSQELLVGAVCTLGALYNNRLGRGLASVRFDSWDFLAAAPFIERALNPPKLVIVAARAFIEMSYKDYWKLLIDEFASPGCSDKVVNTKCSIAISKNNLAHLKSLAGGE